MLASRPIVTVGEIMAAFISSADQPLGASSQFELAFAGAESTVAIGLARLGVPATFIGRVGDDGLGRAALRHLRGESVNVDHVIVDPTASTGVLIRNASPSQDLEVVYARKAAAGSNLNPADVPPDVIAAARAIHLTGITPMLSDSARTTVMRTAENASQAGVPVSFDPNHRWRLGTAAQARTAMRPILPFADLVLASVEETRMLADCEDARRAESWLLDQGVRVVVVKDGANGAVATDGSHRWHQPIVPVHVVDPVGAGDAFNAGFLSHFRSTDDIGGALHSGAQLGAASVRSIGDSSGLPYAGQSSPRAAGTVLR